MPKPTPLSDEKHTDHHKRLLLRQPSRRCHEVQTTKVCTDKQRPEADTAVTKKRRPRVHFFPRVFVGRELHIYDYTSNERKKTWYTPDEFSSFRREIRDIVRRCNEEDPKSLLQETRGLEHKLGDRRARRKATIKAVVDEQDRMLQQQPNARQQDWTALAILYMQECDSATQIAIETAANDAQQAGHESSLLGGFPTTDVCKTSTGPWWGGLWRNHMSYFSSQ